MIYHPGDKIKTLCTGNTFFVEKECGKGGMGMVYAARREKDQKLYALKTIREDKLENAQSRLVFTRSFKQESEVWIILGKHRNIVQAHWFDLTQHYQPLLIMEYVEGHQEYGSTLEDWLKCHERLDLPTSLNFAIQVLTGLIYARDIVNKELNIPFIHQDLKPANLLITKDGIVKVTDFGLVRAFKGGTPAYMAPEQRQGRPIPDKTDIYALAIIIYEMITGYRPFASRPEPIPGIPAELNNIILKCLEEAPEDRFKSFSELRDKLQDVHKRVTDKFIEVNDAPEPLSAEDHNSRGSGFDQLGFHEKAISCYDMAIGLNAGDARYYVNRGNAYLCLSQWGKAVINYHKAIEINPQLTEAYINLGNAYSKKQQYEKAIENYNKALTLSPELPEIYISRGNAYSSLYRFQEATEDYHKAIALHPRFAEAYLNLGNVYLCKKEYEKAEKNYSKAIELNPGYAEAYIALAKLYHLAGRDEKEIDNLLKEAIRIDPEIGDE